jgi:chromosome segregation ATPase
MTESRIAAQEQMMEVERQRQREEDDRMEALNERIRGIQQAQESWEMLKAQQAEELRLMRDSESRRNDEFAVLLRQENERRAELDAKFSSSETRRMHLERERIEINARCDSLTQQVKSSESQLERMRAQFSDQLQSALSEAASREARVAAQLEKALTDNARLLDERNAEVCSSHHYPSFSGIAVASSFSHACSRGSFNGCKRSMLLLWSRHLKLSCPRSKVTSPSELLLCNCPITAFLHR